DHDVRWRERYAPAVRHLRGLARVPPLNRLQGWLRGEVRLDPRHQARRIEPVERRDDHEGEEACIWRAHRPCGGGAGRRALAWDVGDVEGEIELLRARRRVELGAFDVFPGSRVAEAPAGLGILKPVIPAGAVEIRSNLGYAWHRVSVRAWLARCESQRKERDRQFVPGPRHRPLIVRDRVGRTAPAL